MRLKRKFVAQTMQIRAEFPEGARRRSVIEFLPRFFVDFAAVRGDFLRSDFFRFDAQPMKRFLQLVERLDADVRSIRRKRSLEKSTQTNEFAVVLRQLELLVDQTFTEEFRARFHTVETFFSA